MSLSWKTAGFVLGAVMIGCCLALLRSWRSGDSPRASLHRQEHPSAPSTEAPVIPQAPRRSEAEPRTADLHPTPALGSSSGKEVLERTEACLRPDLDDRSIGAAELDAIWQCLRSLDWSVVTAPELASWLCEGNGHPRQITHVLSAALYAREPKHALSYLAEFKPPCHRIRESSLQVAAVKAINNFDPAWVLDLERAMTPDALFTGESSEQGILLAEYFMRRGTGVIAAVMEKGGRGEYGGSDGEISRAARVSLFALSTMQGDPNRTGNACGYAETLIQSPTTPPIVGGVLGPFLASRQTWPGGDSERAMQTLSLLMDDPQLKDDAARVLWFTHTQEGPDGCNKVLWKEIYGKIQAIATENGWQSPNK